MTASSIDRRRAVQLLAATTAAALAPSGGTAAGASSMVTRKVPVSGEEIPVIGMGSSDTFDVGQDGMQRAVLQGVLRNLVAAGAQQIGESFDRLRTQHLDLLQIHNLLDWREHVPTIRALQASGKVKYSGITHYRADAHAELERVRGRPLPGWAEEIGCRSWGQFFLRYVISHPAVTCVIPATSKPAHMVDNAAAGQAPLPDDAGRRRMAEFWQELQ